MSSKITISKGKSPALLLQVQPGTQVTTVLQKPPAVINDGSTVGIGEAPMDGEQYARENAQWEIVRGTPGPEGPEGPQGEPGSSTSVFNYKVDTHSTAPNDPGTGLMKYNTVDQTQATKLYFDWLTTDGFNPVLLFQITHVDDQLVLQDKDLAVNYQLFKLLGPAINHPDWFEVPVAFVEGTTTFDFKQNIVALVRSVGQKGDTGPVGPPSFPDAPVDTKIYGRKDAAWTQVPSATGAPGVWKLQDGTVPAPGLAWASEATMGWYRPGAGRVTFVAGGVEIERTDTTTTETFTELFPKATGGASSISLYSTTAANYANYQGFGLYMDPNGANISTFAQGTGVVLPMVFGASRFIFNSSIAVAPATGGSTILLDKPASGQEAAIYGRVGAGITRWGMSLGNTAAESAPANGSDFMLSRFDNTGAFLANPVHVNRATGAATLTCTSTGTAASDRNLSLNQASSGWAQLAFTAASAVKTLRMGSAGNLEIVNTANSLVLLDLKDSGAFVLPANPAFIASGASTAVGDLTWVTANVNIGGNFNPGNGRFTAPVTGTYLFSYHQLMPNAPAGEFRIGLYLNGFGYYGSRVIFNKAAGQWQSIQITAHVRMSANDYLVVRYESGPADLYTDGAYIQFDGNLVG